MPFQNRVDPFSRIHADPSRGMFMGNRGMLHDATGRLVTQAWRADIWIICALEFRDRYRKPMAPGAYTQLFFLDEATTLAAGHRPCFECRRADAKAYVAAIEKRTGERLAAPAINAALKSEMTQALRNGERERVEAASLPPGAMFAVGEAAYLVANEGARRWSFTGYAPPEPLPQTPVTRLTPRLNIAALEGGYQPAVAE